MKYFLSIVCLFLLLGCALVASDTNSTIGLYTVINDIDNQSPWNFCQQCSNGVNGGTASCSVSQNNTVPALTNNGSVIVTDSPNGANPSFANCLWFVLHTVPLTTIQEGTLDFYFQMPTGSSAASQAIEFEFLQVDLAHTGKYFEFAVQADFADGLWRTFDRASGSWQSTSFPLNRFSENTWHHLVFHGHRVGNSSLVDDYVIFDGNTMNFNAVHEATNARSNQFNTMVQLDGNEKGTPYSLIIDNMVLTYR